MVIRVFSLFLCSVLLTVGSTKSVHTIWLPLSLQQTDVDGVDGEESGVSGAAVLSTPILITGAIPEDLVMAIGCSYTIPPRSRKEGGEDNLLVLSGVELSTVLENKGKLRVIFDVTKAKKVGVISIGKVVNLAVAAVQKTLYHYAQGSLVGEMECVIDIIDKRDEKTAKGALKSRLRFKVSRNNEFLTE